MPLASCESRKRKNESWIEKAYYRSFSRRNPPPRPHPSRRSAVAPETDGSRTAPTPSRRAAGGARKRAHSPRIQPPTRPTEAPRARLPATARICEAAMAPGRGIFPMRRKCAHGGREAGEPGGGRDAQRGLKRVEKGREIAAYLSVSALNLSDFVEIGKSASIAFAADGNPSGRPKKPRRGPRRGDPSPRPPHNSRTARGREARRDA